MVQRDEAVTLAAWLPLQRARIRPERRWLAVPWLGRHWRHAPTACIRCAACSGKRGCGCSRTFERRRSSAYHQWYACMQTKAMESACVLDCYKTSHACLHPAIP